MIESEQIELAFEHQVEGTGFGWNLALLRRGRWLIGRLGKRTTPPKDVPLLRVPAFAGL